MKENRLMPIGIDNKSSLVDSVDSMNTIGKVREMLDEISVSDTKLFMDDVSDGALASIIYGILNKKSDLANSV